MQPNQDIERIREAVEKNPRKMTLQLARDLGVPEVEVIRAFPSDRVVELEIARWEELLQGLETLGSVRVLVSNGAATIEVDGQFGGFSTTGEFFNVQTDTLDMHIRWRELSAVFAVEKPGHMDGMATRSFQFFDQTGAAAFKVFLNFGGPLSPEREAQFIELRARFKHSGEEVRRQRLEAAETYRAAWQAALEEVRRPRIVANRYLAKQG